MAQETTTMTLVELLDEQKVELHPITNDYPEMNDEERERLYNDIIQAKEIRQPLLLVDNGKKKLIFDGRNRYNLLRDRNLKITEAFEPTQNPSKVNIPVIIYTDISENELRLISDSFNLSRRHLSPQQKSIIAFSPRLKKERAEIQKKIDDNKKKPDKAEKNVVKVQALAEVAGTNKEYVQKWKNVHDALIEYNKKVSCQKMYDKLTVIAYQSKINFDKICALFRYPGKKTDKDKKDFFIANIDNIMNACKEIVENSIDANNKPIDIAQKIDDIKQKNELPIKEPKPSLDDGEFIKIFFNFNIGKAQMERISLVIRNELEMSGIKPPYKVAWLTRQNDEEIKKVSDSLKTGKIDVYEVTGEEVLPDD